MGKKSGLEGSPGENDNTTTITSLYFVTGTQDGFKKKKKNVKKNRKKVEFVQRQQVNSHNRTFTRDRLTVSIEHPPGLQCSYHDNTS